MTTFYLLWILLGDGRSQTLSTERMATLAECQAAQAAVISFYNKEYAYSWDPIDDQRVKCIKVEVK